MGRQAVPEKDHPSDFKDWPPPDWGVFQKEVEDKWKGQEGRKGKHWGLQVWGNNPISGYKVVYKPWKQGEPTG
jgi:hypothetical protein